MPPWAAATSAAANTRSLYSAVNVRRLASTTTSGSGRGASAVAPAPLRSASLRSASLRSARATADEEPKTTTLGFTLILLLALLTKFSQENCLSYVGPEGASVFVRSGRGLWALWLLRDALNPEPAPWILRFDRQKLYEEIWSEPAEKVAARYGVSGVAISKVCRCLGIPKPPRGYWAKKAAGRRPTPRPKLPQFDETKAVDQHRSR